MGATRAAVRTLLIYVTPVALLLPVGSAAYASPPAGSWVSASAARHGSPRPAGRPAAQLAAVTVAPVPAVTTLLAPSGFDQLQADLASMARQSGAQVGISLQELSGRGRQPLAINGGQGFYAASAYKLPLLMAEAQQVATGQVSPQDTLCYDPSDAEDGWFTDYQPGACFSREDLAVRTGRFSDNTAARILVRYLGGPEALNGYAHANGMGASTLWQPNTTTADDLAAIWVNEVLGNLGGSAAQQWLYPTLTHTVAESGIPAGLPASATVIHKTGDMYGTQNDAADVTDGQVRYVLAVGVTGLDESVGWSLIARISARIWQYESSRPAYSAPIIAPLAPRRPDARH
jgi:beta-lactamase class A